METYIISAFLTIAFGYLLWENFQLRKTIDTKDKAYNVLRKAYQQERNSLEDKKQIIDN